MRSSVCTDRTGDLMTSQQPENWHERATLRKTEGHQIRLAFSNHCRGLAVSCICMKKNSKFSGDHDSGYEPIAEVGFIGDIWGPYEAYHRMLEVPVEEYRPGPRAVLGQMSYSSVDHDAGAEEEDRQKQQGDHHQ